MKLLWCIIKLWDSWIVAACDPVSGREYDQISVKTADEKLCFRISWESEIWCRVQAKIKIWGAIQSLL